MTSRRKTIVHTGKPPLSNDLVHTKLMPQKSMEKVMAA